MLSPTTTFTLSFLNLVYDIPSLFHLTSQPPLLVAGWCYHQPTTHLHLCARSISMKNENTQDQDSQVELICEYFISLTRQGPGSTEATLKALSFIPELKKDSLIVDIGCGTGSPTIDLARGTKAQILGIDLFQPFIESFKTRMAKQDLENRVKGIQASMEDLPLQNEEADLIWSEGAIYNIGFRRGIEEWKRFLKKKGYLAVTELSWLTRDRPDEINNFWKEAYPEIDTIGTKVIQLEEAGYLPVATFVLPENCWTDNYYNPQKEARQNFLNKYKNNPTVKEFITSQQQEAELYDKYKAYYNYVFYIAHKL